jgi:hypothetical protein
MAAIMVTKDTVYTNEAIAALRRNWIRSWVTAITIIALVAGVAAASDIHLPLWFYILVTAITYAICLLAFSLSSPRYRFLLISVVGRRRALANAHQPDEVPLRLVSAGRHPAMSQVAAGRTVDRSYEAGFRFLVAGDNSAIAVVPSNPRDVSKKDDLLYQLFSSGYTRTPCAVDLKPFRIPLPVLRFERELPEGTHDADHLLAVKDLIYLPQLYSVLGRGHEQTGGIRPFVWPEHCVDPALLGSHDLIIVGGGDTNFWHAALFEPIWQRFTEPRSTIPLAVDLRDATADLGRYGSRGINVRLAGEVPGVGASPRVLDERSFPTYAIILGCDNPFSTRQPAHWCVFVAGTRSLGTSGAVLALAAIIQDMEAENTSNYFSLVLTDDSDVHAGVSGLLLRVTRVEQAWHWVGGKLERRQQRSIPTDHPDPQYSDSYIPVEVEFFDNRTGQGAWRKLVKPLEPQA